jgi:hypothetical protein
VPAFANQIDDGPVAFPLLNIFQLQVNEFGSAKAASQEHSEDGAISFSAKSLGRWRIGQGSPLFCGEPVSEPDAELFHSLKRLIPAASSGLSSPASDASQANLRSAANR